MYWSENFPTSENNSFENEQYSVTFLHCENERHPQQSIIRPKPNKFGITL